jgi:hypothetical protein
VAHANVPYFKYRWRFLGGWSGSGFIFVCKRFTLETFLTNVLKYEPDTNLYIACKNREKPYAELVKPVSKTFRK